MRRESPNSQLGMDGPRTVLIHRRWRFTASALISSVPSPEQPQLSLQAGAGVRSAGSACPKVPSAMKENMLMVAFRLSASATANRAPAVRASSPRLVADRRCRERPRRSVASSPAGTDLPVRRLGASGRRSSGARGAIEDQLGLAMLAVARPRGTDRGSDEVPVLPPRLSLSGAST